MLKMALTQQGQLILALGLTAENLDTLRAGRALVVDLADVEAFAAEPPAAVVVLYGPTDHDLMEQVAPFLDRDATLGGSASAEGA